MMSCQQATRLMSDRLERELSLRERFALVFHLAMCRFCRGFSNELKRLRDFARRYGSKNESEEPQNQPHLSDEARQRIEQRLREESH